MVVSLLQYQDLNGYTKYYNFAPHLSPHRTVGHLKILQTMKGNIQKCAVILKSTVHFP